eukprot:5946544-Prymnesium_polylepis.1
MGAVTAIHDTGCTSVRQCRVPALWIWRPWRPVCGSRVERNASHAPNVYWTVPPSDLTLITSYTAERSRGRLRDAGAYVLCTV